MPEVRRNAHDGVDLATSVDTAVSCTPSRHTSRDGHLVRRLARAVSAHRVIPRLLDECVVYVADCFVVLVESVGYRSKEHLRRALVRVECAVRVELRDDVVDVQDEHKDPGGRLKNTLVGCELRLRVGSCGVKDERKEGGLW